MPWITRLCAQQAIEKPASDGAFLYCEVGASANGLDHCRNCRVLFRKLRLRFEASVLGAPYRSRPLVSLFFARSVRPARRKTGDAPKSASEGNRTASRTPQNCLVPVERSRSVFWIRAPSARYRLLHK